MIYDYNVTILAENGAEICKNLSTPHETLDSVLSLAKMMGHKVMVEIASCDEHLKRAAT